MFAIVDGYPPDTLRQSDLFSGSAQRTILDVDRAGREIRRRERIIVAEIQFLPDDIVEGRPCLGEQTIRTIGGALGLVDPVTVHRLTDRIEYLERRVREVETENTALREINATLPQIAPVRAPVADTAVAVEPVRPFEEALA